MFYILSISILGSCVLLRKKEVVQKFQASDLKQNIILGDTTFNRKLANCQYIVEDVSTYIVFPDSLKNKTFKQIPAVGDTMKHGLEHQITLCFEQNNAIDTFYYQVNLDCDISYIPNSFSEYKDGISDPTTWEIPDLKEYPNNLVRVYNRKGDKVFEQKGYYTGWDGKANISDTINNIYVEKKLPEGIYFYIIDLKDTINDNYIGHFYFFR